MLGAVLLMNQNGLLIAQMSEHQLVSDPDGKIYRALQTGEVR